MNALIKLWRSPGKPSLSLYLGSTSMSIGIRSKPYDYGTWRRFGVSFRCFNRVGALVLFTRRSGAVKRSCMTSSSPR